MALNAPNMWRNSHVFFHPGYLPHTQELMSKWLLDITIGMSNLQPHLTRPESQLSLFFPKFVSSIATHISEWFHHPTTGSSQKPRSQPGLYFFPSSRLASPISKFEVKLRILHFRQALT